MALAPGRLEKRGAESSLALESKGGIMRHRFFGRISPVMLPVCGFVLLAPKLSAQATSTSQERAGWARLAHQLERNPLDPRLSREGSRAVARLVEIHDFHVVLCDEFFRGFDGQYKYSQEMVRQYVLATAAFQIEHGADMVAENLAGAESALRAYQVILRKDPKARSEWLEELEKEENGGTLKDAVRKSCPSGDS